MTTETTSDRANAVVKTTFDFAARAVHFDVAGDGGGRATIQVARMHPDLQTYAMYHGLKQRGGDAAALPTIDVRTGKPAARDCPVQFKRAPTPGERIGEIRRVVDHLNAGGREWDLARVSAPRGPDPDILLAIARVKKWAGVEAALAACEKLAAEKKISVLQVVEVLGAGPRVAEEVARIRSERTGLKISLDDLEAAKAA